MSRILNLLKSLNEICFLSGYESTFTDGKVPDLFAKYGAKIDSVGNLWVEKKSLNQNAKTILIEAHMDVIGLVVKDVLEGGFLSIASCGGMDSGILPGTEFIIHSGKDLKGIATSIPPHLMKNSKNASTPSLSDLFLDCGFRSKKEAEEFVSVGAPVSFAATCEALRNHCICSPYLDNKAAVIALLLTIEKVKSPHNLYFCFTVGEETTSRGVKRAIFPIKPDFAFVVDAGFAFTKGLNRDSCIEFGLGPSVSIADTLTRSVANWIIESAEKQNIPLQVVVEPGGTGTSATALQLREGGIPCALISIPVKYMHTPSEVVSEHDIIGASDLIARLLSIEEINFKEGLGLGTV